MKLWGSNILEYKKHMKEIASSKKIKGGGVSYREKVLLHMFRVDRRSPE